nr:hypothetical protein CFP56_30928 [Quercus suber]
MYLALTFRRSRSHPASVLTRPTCSEPYQPLMRYCGMRHAACTVLLPNYSAILLVDTQTLSSFRQAARLPHRDVKSATTDWPRAWGSAWSTHVCDGASCIDDMQHAACLLGQRKKPTRTLELALPDNAAPRSRLTEKLCSIKNLVWPSELFTSSFFVLLFISKTVIQVLSST